MRVEAHWREVKRKQDLAKHLSGQLEVAKQRREDLTRQSLQAVYHVSAQQTRDWLQSEVASARVECTRLTNELLAAVEAPLPVIQPLPRSEHAGLVWVFHMHMPSAFCRLSRAAFLAQQLLLPVPEHSKDLSIRAPSFRCHLVEHYNQQQRPCTYLAAPKPHPGSPGCVQLHSCSGPPGSKEVGPKHVDEFYTR